MKKLIVSFLLLVAPAAFAQPAKPAAVEARHVQVLFLGAPTANGPHHDPVERYRVIKKALGVDGIDFTYTEALEDLKPEVLSKYDALLMYGNWKENGTLESSQLQALTSYIDNGGAFLPIHCASACFGGNDDFSKLVGGHFQSHQTGVFTAKIVMPDHPVMRGYKAFETWDETYVHDRLTKDRVVLQNRDQEPWTWVREQGKGKVFYTAYGHDMRTWNQVGFHDLMRRAILWSVGPEVRAKLAAMKLPTLETEEVILPGYREHKTITTAQKPLSPQDSMKLAQVPNGFDISLFAAEPDIVNPIYVTWDYRGRAYVVETVDYPNNLQAGNIGHDRIHICEDTNGDGKADKFTLFADKLSIPTSAVWVNGGIICTNGTEMLFLKDTNGDDKADVRQVIFNGINTGDTHAAVSNLRYGFDGWVYATTGYSGLDTTIGGERQKFSTGLFRFKPDGSKMEFLQGTTNNTWGLGFTEDFDILGSTANGNPSFYLTFPRSTYTAAGVDQPRTPPADNNPMFFPASMDIRQVDQLDRYTAAAGHSFYTSTRFPAEWRDTFAFVCEPTGKLIGRFDVKAKGAGFTAPESPNNLYCSADAWSGPVQAETGPDGAVWISDWYNIIIQHNPTPSKASAGYDAKTGKGNAYESPLRDTSLGRIYRVYPKGSKNDANPKLNPSDLNSLIAALSHPNLFWRLMAQQLIVESKSQTAVAKLKEIVANTPVTEANRAGIHAFYALQGLNALDTATVKAGLASNSRGLRRAAIANAPADETLADAFAKDGVLVAHDSRELAELFAGLARVNPSERIGRMLHATLIAQKNDILSDATLSDAWQFAGRHHPAGVLLAAAEDASSEAAAASQNLIADPGFESGALGPWSVREYKVQNPGSVQLSIVDGGRNGGKALKISSATVADAGAGAVFQVKPHTRYRIGGWIKTENLENKGGQGAMFNIHGGVATKGISGTKDWTEMHAEFESNEGEVLMHCLFGGYGGGTGTVYFDDVYLTEVSGGDVSGAIDEVARHFASAGDPLAVQSVSTALASAKGGMAKALITALGAKPVEVKPVVKKFTPDGMVHEKGQEIYGRTCIACHGPEGKGVPGAFPPLDGSPWATGDPSIPARIVTAGLQGPIEVLGQKFENLMPPLPDLKDDEVAAVITYVRQSWSNDASPVDAAAVKAARDKGTARGGKPWTAAELK